LKSLKKILKKNWKNKFLLINMHLFSKKNLIKIITLGLVIAILVITILNTKSKEHYFVGEGQKTWFEGETKKTEGVSSVFLSQTLKDKGTSISGGNQIGLANAIGQQDV